MCGICGIAFGDGPPNRARLDAMSAKLVHHEPDSDGTFVDERVGIAARRLSSPCKTGGLSRPIDRSNEGRGGGETGRELVRTPASAYFGDQLAGSIPARSTEPASRLWAACFVRAACGPAATQAGRYQATMVERSRGGSERSIARIRPARRRFRSAYRCRVAT